MHGIEISLKTSKKIKGVRLLSENTSIDFKQDDDSVSFTVPQLDVLKWLCWKWNKL